MDDSFSFRVQLMPPGVTYEDIEYSQSIDNLLIPSNPRHTFKQVERETIRRIKLFRRHNVFDKERVRHILTADGFAPFEGDQVGRYGYNSSTPQGDLHLIMLLGQELDSDGPSYDSNVAGPSHQYDDGDATQQEQEQEQQEQQEREQHQQQQQQEQHQQQQQEQQQYENTANSQEFAANQSIAISSAQPAIQRLEHFHWIMNADQAARFPVDASVITHIQAIQRSRYAPVVEESGISQRVEHIHSVHLPEPVERAIADDTTHAIEGRRDVQEARVSQFTANTNVEQIASHPQQHGEYLTAEVEQKPRQSSHLIADLYPGFARQHTATLQHEDTEVEIESSARTGPQSELFQAPLSPLSQSHYQTPALSGITRISETQQTTTNKAHSDEAQRLLSQRRLEHFMLSEDEVAPDSAQRPRVIQELHISEDISQSQPGNTLPHSLVQPDRLSTHHYEAIPQAEASIDRNKIGTGSLKRPTPKSAGHKPQVDKNLNMSTTLRVSEGWSHNMAWNTARPDTLRPRIIRNPYDIPSSDDEDPDYKLILPLTRTSITTGMIRAPSSTDSASSIIADQVSSPVADDVLMPPPTTTKKVDSTTMPGWSAINKQSSDPVKLASVFSMAKHGGITNESRPAASPSSSRSASNQPSSSMLSSTSAAFRRSASLSNLSVAEWTRQEMDILKSGCQQERTSTQIRKDLLAVGSDRSASAIRSQKALMVRRGLLPPKSSKTGVGKTPSVQLHWDRRAGQNVTPYASDNIVGSSPSFPRTMQATSIGPVHHAAAASLSRPPSAKSISNLDQRSTPGNLKDIQTSTEVSSVADLSTPIQPATQRLKSTTLKGSSHASSSTSKPFVYQQTTLPFKPAPVREDNGVPGIIDAIEDSTPVVKRDKGKGRAIDPPEAGSINLFGKRHGDAVSDHCKFREADLVLDYYDSSEERERKKQKPNEKQAMLPSRSVGLNSYNSVVPRFMRYYEQRKISTTDAPVASLESISTAPLLINEDELEDFDDISLQNEDFEEATAVPRDEATRSEAQSTMASKHDEHTKDGILEQNQENVAQVQHVSAMITSQQDEVMDTEVHNIPIKSIEHDNATDKASAYITDKVEVFAHAILNASQDDNDIVMSPHDHTEQYNNADSTTPSITDDITEEYNHAVNTTPSITSSERQTAVEQQLLIELQHAQNELELQQHPVHAPSEEPIITLVVDRSSQAQVVMPTGRPLITHISHTAAMASPLSRGGSTPSVHRQPLVGHQLDDNDAQRSRVEKRCSRGRRSRGRGCTNVTAIQNQLDPHSLGMSLPQPQDIEAQGHSERLPISIVSDDENDKDTQNAGQPALPPRCGPDLSHQAMKASTTLRTIAKTGTLHSQLRGFQPNIPPPPRTMKKELSKAPLIVLDGSDSSDSE